MKYKIKQIIPDGQFTDENKWRGSAGGSSSYMKFVGKTADGYAHYSKLVTTSRYNHIIRPINPEVDTFDTNKYLMILTGYSNISQTVNIADQVNVKQALGRFVANTPKTIAAIFSFTTAQYLSTRYYSTTEAYEIYLKEFQVIDLTATFGEGNEPTTPEEFAKRLGFSSIDDVPYFEFGETDFNVGGCSIYQLTDTSARRRMIMASYKSILPAEYQRVEYLEGYSSNCWINTNKYGMLSSELTARVEYMGEKSSGNNFAQIMGVYNSSGNSITLNGKVVQSASASSRFGTKTFSASGSFVIPANRLFNCWINKKSFGWTFIPAGTTREFAINYDTEFSTQNDTNKTITIFRAIGSGAYGRWRFYDFTHSRSGVMIQHLIPCYRKADSVAGMYDVIEGKFYTNAGTGTFTVGRNIKG